MKPFPLGPELTPEEVARYSRHLVLADVGMDGQRRLKGASVLLIGAGGLGAPLGLYLAAAGVGHIGIVDYDVVELSNLQRQVIHGTSDLGRRKTDSAASRLRSINPDIEVTVHDTKITSANAFDLLRPYDLVIDGTDNFPTRYLVNDAAVLLGKPNIYGSIFEFHGQVSVFAPPDGPCYRCLYPEPPPPELVPSCAEGGVLGILPGVVGSLQATEAIKLIIGRGDPLIGRMLLYDAMEMSFREVHVGRDPACPLCGERRTIKELIDYDQFCGVRGAEAPTSSLTANTEITVEEVKRRLDRGDALTLLDVRSPEEWAICHIEGALLIPVENLAERTEELDRSANIIVHCRTGIRSARALALLQGAGFPNVQLMHGGIIEWATKIDHSMPRY